MDTRSVAMIVSGLIAAMIAASLWAIASLPLDAMVPAHFGLSGKPDSWARPVIALSVLPFVAIALAGMFFWKAQTEPADVIRSATAFRTTVVGVIGFLAGIHGLMVASAMGHVIDVTRVAILLSGVLFLVLGNILGKVRPNSWLGIRTPWTLRDERVWDRTQRFGGWLFVGAGALLALAALAMPAGKVLGVILFAALAVVIVVPCAKSYLLWRDRQNI